MKKILINIILFTVSQILVGQSSNYEILFKVEFERKLSEELLEDFKDKKDKSLADKEISAYQNPKPEFYSLKLSNNKIETTYLEILDSEANRSHVSVQNYPLGKKSYRIKNDTILYLEHDFNGKNLYSYENLIDNEWQVTHNDSIILGYKVFEISRVSDEGIIKAWVTNDLPEGLGIYKYSFLEGFIIAIELHNKPNNAFEKDIIKVYPYKIKKLKNEIKFKLPKEVYTTEQIKEIYLGRNNVINKSRKIKN